MPTKKKPKWGWRDGGFYSLFSLSDEDFTRIEKILPNVDTLTEDVRLQLNEVISRYSSDSWRMSQNPPPRLAKIKAAIEAIHNETSVLIKHLGNIDDFSWNELYLVGFKDKKDVLGRIENKSSDVHELLLITQKALDHIGKDRGGRPPERQPLLGIICYLVCIYESATSLEATITWHDYKRRYTGNFYNFVHLILKTIDPDTIWSDSSLGQQIKKAIKKLDHSSKKEILQSLQRVPTIDL